MGFMNKLFGKTDAPIKNYQDFWAWFVQNEKTFHSAVKNQDNIEKDFFDLLSPKLDELKDGFYFLAGMVNDDTAELVITVEGVVANIVFAEELVKAAPTIPGWLFTALKPAMDNDEFAISTKEHSFSNENLSFYANDIADCPDEIDISIVHNDFNKDNEAAIANGSLIFLDNYLGELNFATSVDNLTVVGKADAKKPLIPIIKLKEFLIARQKESTEKQLGQRRNTDEDSYSSYEFESKTGMPYIASMNATLLEWDSKASHPWIVTVAIKYDGDNNNGMPDSETYELLEQVESKILEELKDFEGYLNVGRETGDGLREIYFACKDFRKPSKVLHAAASNSSSKIAITFDVYKDKYWRTFNRYTA
jgi:Family of unknown function (DUF695)